MAAMSFKLQDSENIPFKKEIKPFPNGKSKE